MNVLISSAGRRTSLLLAFKEATRKRNSFTYAVDADSLAPAPRFAEEAFLVPRLDDSEYLETLLGIVKEKDVRVLVPTIDTELSLLARERDSLESLGCFPMVSSAEVVRITGDKWDSFQFFSKQGIPIPETVLADSPDWNGLPEFLVRKPRKGSASKGVIFGSKEDIRDCFVPDKSQIIQERVDGSEITVDALLDLKGNLLHYVPRKRIRTLGGESIQGETLDWRLYDDFIASICEVLGSIGAIGPLTLQFFESSRGLVLGEVNPRFGGGFPLGLAAGGNYPEWLLQMVEGKKLQACIGGYQVGLCMSRYNTETFFTRDEQIRRRF